MEYFDQDNLEGDEVDEVAEAIKEIDRENKLKEISKNRRESLRTGELVESIITPKQLTEILTGDKFLTALKISSERTKKTGNETRFHVDICDDGAVLISDIEEGLMDSVGGGNSIVFEYGELPDSIEKNVTDFISIHYHPGMEVLCPSEKDLSSIEPPLDLIAMINGKIIKVLLMNVSGLGKEGSEALSEALSNELELSQAKVQTILSENGVNNVVISYVFNGGKYKLSKDSEQKIKKIGPIICKFE